LPIADGCVMRVAAVFAISLVVAVAGCGSPTAPADTGLAGTVYRGPVTPVCAFNQPCEAPFKAAFTVERGTTRVASFQSDDQGHYQVRVAPGVYFIVPAADAPIVLPSSQVKQVTVGPNGLTFVDLHFDTGIR
jgi:hypothetical protein